MANLEQVLYSMFTESTGTALCDSGDVYGRNWERNQSRTLEDFLQEPSVTINYENNTFTISTFRYLQNSLQLDEICNEFNALFVPRSDNNSNILGISGEAQEWLEIQGFKFKQDYNSYNGESNLSQVIQFTLLELDGYECNYVLMQVHQGCDVRGGYTDARLFRITDMFDAFFTEYVSGSIEFENEEPIQISNTYETSHLTDDCGCRIDEIISMHKDKKFTVNLHLLGE